MKRSSFSFPIFAASVAIAVLALCFAFLMGATIGGSESLEYWFNRYQTFIAALIALGAACVAATPVFKQLSENQKQTEVLTFGALYQLSLSLKLAEQAAWTVRQCVAHHSILETQVAKITQRQPDLLEHLLKLSSKHEPELNAALKELESSDIRLIKDASHLRGAIVLACTQLRAVYLTFRHEIELLVMNEREKPNAAVWAASLQMLKGKTMSAEVGLADSATEAYIVNARAEIARVNAKINSIKTIW